MELLLTDMKKEFENSISELPVFTSRERQQIVNRAVQEKITHQTKTAWFPKMLSGIVLASLFIFVLVMSGEFTQNSQTVRQMHEDLPSQSTGLPFEEKKREAYSKPVIDYAAEQYKTFNQKERRIYEQFQSSLDEQLLKGLDPITVAKFYVQACITGNSKMAYALYTDRQDYVMMSEEEYLNIPVADHGTPEHLYHLFLHLEKGTFHLDDNQISGHIQYTANENADAPSGFKMIKDEDGIWNVSFMPVQ
ncbi:hypothetical protein ACFQPF_02815 [Fictibacillus iocasae]|uniref:DUF4179 domain-containing protein n=1 Tax=Fictibacillus iocasae TaxID=2715437 RepID=A0ABW2NMR7_9BACL